MSGSPPTPACPTDHVRGLKAHGAGSVVPPVCRAGHREDPVWNATTVTKHRDRLLDGDIAGKFLAAVLADDKVKGLLSSEHFPVDGTLLEAWASPKSFRPKNGSGTRAGRSKPPRGATARATFAARGARTTRTPRPPTRCAPCPQKPAPAKARGPGKEARLRLMGRALMENRNGLIPAFAGTDAVTTRASGHAERLAAIALIEPRADRPNPIALGTDKACDTADFVMECREHTVTPHVAQNHVAQNTAGRRSAIDRRTTRHAGYALSQRIRKRVEEAFGWARTVAGPRRMHHRGLPKVGWQFTLAMAADNLVRLPKQPACEWAMEWVIIPG